MGFPLDEVGEEQAVAALLAVIHGDDAQARRVLDEEMTPSERATLVQHLHRLVALADDTHNHPCLAGLAREGETVLLNVVGWGVRTVQELQRRLRTPADTQGR